MVAVLLLVGALLAIGLKLGSSNEHSELCSWPKYKQMPEVTTERDESILLQSRIQSNRNSGESQAPKDDAALRQVSMSRNASNAKVDGSRKRNSTSPRKLTFCTEEQRVARKDWWRWRERFTSLHTKKKSHVKSVSQCLRQLSSSGMDWLLAIDGWAQAAWGTKSIAEFKGTLASKDFKEENKGDFLADWSSMFDSIVDLGDEKLTAAMLERINDHFVPGPHCQSTHDPLKNPHYSSIQKHCSRPSALFEDQLRSIDPQLYDSSGQRHEPPSASFRLSKLASYLDSYYREVDGLGNDAHHERLRALTTFAWNYSWLHPFCDGNGRTRTLILQRELCRLGYHPAVNFDNNFELFYQKPGMLQDELIEAMFMWEDAYAFECIPWTPPRVASHRSRFGASAVGLPMDCSAESAHRLMTSATI
mmetsp:Transcript_73271/g.115573  ORF Transcript_73271/g.115573 Transcript_73271/m.115573 type:complete len:419 (+) Transcript_73271:46-1302(+)